MNESMNESIKECDGRSQRARRRKYIERKIEMDVIDHLTNKKNVLEDISIS